MGGPFAVSGGTMPLPEGPGLGIDLDLDVLRAHPYVPVELNHFRAGQDLEARPRR